VGPTNLAVGLGALGNNTTGIDNTVSGAFAMTSNTTGRGNTANGRLALSTNTAGVFNTAVGSGALANNSTGSSNTAVGGGALGNNTTGLNNTALGAGANLTGSDFTNATALGAGAIVNASNKMRLGNGAVTVIEAQVNITAVSDRHQKERFRPVHGETILSKLRGIPVESWNYIGHDATRFRHYGPVAQDFFAAFGHDGVGSVGTPTTINAGDLAGILLSAVQALEQRAHDQRELINRLEQTNAELRSRLEGLELAMQSAWASSTLR
jgi:hypothetical protein